MRGIWRRFWRGLPACCTGCVLTAAAFAILRPGPDFDKEAWDMLAECHRYAADLEVRLDSLQKDIEP